MPKDVTSDTTLFRQLEYMAYDYGMAQVLASLALVAETQATEIDVRIERGFYSDADVGELRAMAAALRRLVFAKLSSLADAYEKRVPRSVASNAHPSNDPYENVERMDVLIGEWGWGPLLNTLAAWAKVKGKHAAKALKALPSSETRSEDARSLRANKRSLAVIERELPPVIDHALDALGEEYR